MPHHIPQTQKFPPRKFSMSTSRPWPPRTATLAIPKTEMHEWCARSMRENLLGKLPPRPLVFLDSPWGWDWQGVSVGQCRRKIPAPRERWPGGLSAMTLEMCTCACTLCGPRAKLLSWWSWALVLCLCHFWRRWRKFLWTLSCWPLARLLWHLHEQDNISPCCSDLEWAECRSIQVYKTSACRWSSSRRTRSKTTVRLIEWWTQKDF